MSWAPIVTGSARAEIHDTIADLAAELAAQPPQRTLDALGDAVIMSAYLEADDTVVDHDHRGATALAALVTLLSGGGFGASLFGGAARVGWTIAHLAGGDDASAACAAIDDSIAHRLATWNGDYDLTSGLVGLGVYAIERGEAGHPLARCVLDHLERRACPRAGGLAWHTPAVLLVPHEREIAPDGYWNLGIAHGMPGVIGLLARYVAAGIDVDRSRALLDGAVAHVLAIAAPGDCGRYPPWQPTSGPVSQRLAWCYGDLGVAVILLGAGMLVDQADWHAAGLELARDCARRSVARAAAGVVDAGLCHGAAGIGHLFNRMAQATGDAMLADAARAWIARTCEMIGPGGIAGRTLLTGAPGIALVLHAAISEVEPAWDRLLLADLRPDDARRS